MTPRSSLPLIVLLLASPTLAQQQFKTQTVPKLPGCCTHQTYDVNDNGTVTGVSTAPDYSKHMITWSKPNGLRDWGWGYGRAINNAGDVVGTDLASNGTIWIDGSITTIAAPLLDINDSQLAVGYDVRVGAMRWSPGTAGTAIGWGLGSEAHAVNNAGTIVGCKLVGGYAHAAVGDLDIHAIGIESCATGINSSGQVTGWAGDGNRRHGWLWDPTTKLTTDLGFPTGCVGVSPTAISDNGQIVGWMCNPAHAFVWTGSGVPQDLNPLTGLTNGTNKQAMAVNRWGQILLLNRRLLTPMMHVNLAPNINPAQVGQPVTFMAYVYSIAGPAPDGDLIQFKLGPKVVATVPLVNHGHAQFTVSFPYPGYPFTVSAVYVGNGIYARAARSIPEIVNP